MTEPVPTANTSASGPISLIGRGPGVIVAAFSLLLLLFIPQLFPQGIDPQRQQNWLDLFAKFMALAILALSVDLVWGYTGLLSLGQGVFFGIGAYMLAYCLTLDKAAKDAPPTLKDGQPTRVTFTYALNSPPTQLLYNNDGRYRIDAILLRVIKPGASGTKGIVSKLPAGSLSPDAAEPIHNGEVDLSGPVGKEQALSLKGVVMQKAPGQGTVSAEEAHHLQEEADKEKILRRLEKVDDKLYFDIIGDASKVQGQITLVLTPEMEEPRKPGEVPPQFMQYTGYAEEDPNYVAPPVWLIAPLGSRGLAIAACLALPTLVAGLFGFVIFRLRVRGVYFALVTQAFLVAVFTLVRNQQRFTGGVVGIKDMSSLELFGTTFDAAAHVRSTVYLVSSALLVSYVLCALLVRSKFGKILAAIRDNENRILALGYNTALYKTFLFAFAGLLAGLAGGLYVLANHPVCDTTYLSVPFSIEAVIWVAVGGRGGLLGAVVGVLLVGFGQYYISSAVPDFWPIALGLLFVVTVLFLPRGLTPVAGPGALLGLLAGMFFIIYLDNFDVTLPLIMKEPGKLLDAVDKFIGFRSAGRIFVGIPIILLSVFLPKLITMRVKWLAGLVTGRHLKPGPVSPIAG